MAQPGQFTDGFLCCDEGQQNRPWDQDSPTLSKPAGCWRRLLSLHTQRRKEIFRGLWWVLGEAIQWPPGWPPVESRPGKQNTSTFDTSVLYHPLAFHQCQCMSHFWYYGDLWFVLYCIMLKLLNLSDGPPILNVTGEQSVLVKQRTEHLNIVALESLDHGCWPDCTELCNV